MNRFAELSNELYEIRVLASDEDILNELEAIATLPDAEILETAPWYRQESNHIADDSDWYKVALFLALSGHIAERKLLSGVPLLLQKSCYGDPGETMRGLCHALEGAARDDMNALIPICRNALSFPEPGARLWAAFELMRFRDKDSIPLLEKLASDDPAPLVREQAEWSIERITEA